ncbi:peptidylprolyl isomerase [Leptolyngbya sp. CCY15150]|uniref:peptidylprolyl isomerase n=1 Tax=Leptolyngbya sp. CCY15150 TaxID=2767772 RepID=UPI001951C3D1|nr:peptidylprolyl isomerase [Leptolyngbya sp. CCY15150]
MSTKTRSLDELAHTLTINQQPVSLQHILRQFRRAGKLDTVITDILSLYVIEQELNRFHISQKERVIEASMVQYREQYGLMDEGTFQEWLLNRGLDAASFCEHIEFNVTLKTFKAELAAPKLLETFIEHKLNLDQVVLSRITVDHQDLADELKLQLEEGADFEVLAREYSCSEDALTHGMMGILSRADVQNVFGIDAYQATVGEFMSPIQRDGCWHLLRVDGLLPAALDDTVIPYLQEQIFEQWLATRIQSLQVDVCLSQATLVY